MMTQAPHNYPAMSLALFGCFCLKVPGNPEKRFRRPEEVGHSDRGAEPKLAHDVRACHAGPC